jgi:rhamnosyltransferase
MMADIPISVVIRTLDAASTLPAVLAGLVMKPRDELIVVDSGSSDNTLEIAARAGARIMHIPQTEFTYGRSLNLGFGAATNDWILALSSHCIPIPVRQDHLQLFRNAVARFHDGFVAAVGPFHNSEWDRVLLGGVTFYELADFKHGFGFPAGNPNCLYRKECWQQHPFDESLAVGEDFEWYVWALRQGWTVAAVHAASARYASARPMKALYLRGRLDRRIGVSLIESPRLGAGEFAIHMAKLVAFGLLGRVTWASVKNGFAYKLGAWVEGRSELRRPTRGPHG